MTDAIVSHYDILFGVRRSVRYHDRRHRFYLGCHKLVIFFALLFGSATIMAFGSALGGSQPLWVKLLPAVLSTLLTALDLTVGFVDKAWRHKDLARRHRGLEKRVISAGEDAPQKVLNDINAERLDIEADELPVLRTLDRLCRNELMQAMGYPMEDAIKVSFLRRLFAHFI